MNLAKAMLVIEELDGWLWSDLDEKERKLLGTAHGVVDRARRSLFDD